MNAKKNKNKNRPNKPPNPNPPQKIDEANVVVDKIDEVKLEEHVESAQKIEERIPEVISEVISPSPLESKEKEEDSPRKPKRNKGKKKNKDKEELESQDEKVEQQIEDAKVESAEITQEKPDTPVVPEVTPSARKKKNKNKKTAEAEPKVENKAEEEIVLTEIIKEDESEDKATKQDASVKVTEFNVTEHETKAKKKNKKKKHRHDSEKSDKAEELSCTAAFQILLKEDICDTKLDTGPTINKDIEQGPTNPNISNEGNISKVHTAPDVEERQELPKETEITSVSQPVEGSSKNKKKNKKDKKIPPSEEYSKECKITPDTKFEIMLPVSITEESKEEMSITEGSSLENVALTEDPIKTKPKIAKPVERKRKDKGDNKNEDILAVTISKELEIKATEVKTQEQTEKVVSEVTTGEVQTEKEDVTKQEKDESIKNKQESEMPKKIDKIDEIESTQNMELKDTSCTYPPDNEMGKKRKKSPKPKKNIKTNEKESDCKATDETNKEIQLEKDSSVSLTSQPLEEKPQESEKDFKLEETMTLNIPDSEKIETLLEPKDKMTEVKSKKKRKKSPKPPQDHGTVKEPIPALEQASKPPREEKECEEKRKENIIQSEEKHITVQDVLSDDIEISSLKADESEGSTCGVTPDIIQYPRATSQDLIDDNNNMMVIQEITAMEEAKIQIPSGLLNEPIIQGSGETPLHTPEIILAAKAKEVHMVAEKPSDKEKTDIKSKMMEVNQDMEELRLSIERSLAELTAIEKDKEKIEKGYMDQVLHITEDPLPTEVKLCMPSEIVGKPLDEKADIESKSDHKTKVFDSDIKQEVVAIEKPIPLVPVEISSTVEKEPEMKGSKTTLPKDMPSITETSSQSESITENADILVAETAKKAESQSVTETAKESSGETEIPPVCPVRRDHKNKGKSKKKGKQDAMATTTQSESATTQASDSKDQSKDSKKEEKPEQKHSQEKGKQQSSVTPDDNNKMQLDQESREPTVSESQYEPIENFEDAMTSSADDINKTFEIIANEANRSIEGSHVNPEIKIIAPIEDTSQEKKDDKVNPLSQPKNLLGHTDIPAPSNRIDYKKEKNKSPNEVTAKVKIKDSVEIEGRKESKQSQTDNIRKFMKNKSIDESFSVTNENDEFIYKYSFRKVFLQSACHVCKKELKQSRVPCSFCSLVFYCNSKHKDEDWPQHQALCFAVSTIMHLKDQKHIYADAQNITGHNYRLLRMQMIISCEKIVKRKLVPWEQEALLYPRICADSSCREWRQNKLKDCDGCGQISYCAEHPDHLPRTHQRWCKSYSLYQKLVSYQQTRGRLEPKMPTRVLVDYQMTEKMNEVLAAMYEEKIDMNDIQYAALTQIATAPLTAAYCLQMYKKICIHANGTAKRSTCTIHVVGAELQFEADALNKWELFFLHLLPDVQDLRVVLVSNDLNPSNLPLELLSKIKMCENCRVHKRRMIFSFQDKMSYHEYWSSDDYIAPDIVCAFNAGIKRSSLYNTKDSWPKTVTCILQQRAPFVVTAHTLTELRGDLARVREIDQEAKVLAPPQDNSFASVRPDRNFVSDHEAPLLFNNYCYMLLCGTN